MTSYCLRHQERVATSRCSACLKPLCEDCTQVTDQGQFCSTECYDKRVASNARVEVLRREHEAGAGMRLFRTLLGYLWPILILCFLVWLWPRLPADFRAPIEGVFKPAKVTKKAR